MTGILCENHMLATVSTATWPTLSLAMMLLTALYYVVHVFDKIPALVNKFRNSEPFTPGEIISPKDLGKLKLARFVWTTEDGKTTLKFGRVDGADRMLLRDEGRGDIELLNFVPENANFRCVSRCFETDGVINENSMLIRVPETNGLRLVLDEHCSYEFHRVRNDKAPREA